MYSGNAKGSKRHINFNCRKKRHWVSNQKIYGTIKCSLTDGNPRFLYSHALDCIGTCNLPLACRSYAKKVKKKKKTFFTFKDLD